MYIMMHHVVLKVHPSRWEDLQSSGSVQGSSPAGVVQASQRPQRFTTVGR